MYTHPKKILFGFIVTLLLNSCNVIHDIFIPKKTIPESVSQEPLRGIIRAYSTDAIIKNARVTVHKLSQTVYTDSLGYFEFPKLCKNDKRRLVKGDSLVVTKATGDSVIIPLGSNLKFLKLYLKQDNQPEPAVQDRVADMHYHVSMKPHNEFGLYMYTNSSIRNTVTEKRLFIFNRTYSWSRFDNAADNDNFLLWSFRPDKLKVLYEGKYRKIGEVDTVFTETNSPKYEKLKTLYEGKWVKPNRESAGNGLFDYSQATMPHLQDGHVKLAFNALSPFEYNLSNDARKRFVSKVFKSKANKFWLRTIGGYNKEQDLFYLTHWQNFLNEKALMSNQKPALNNFGWQFLKSGEQLKTDSTTNFIVNVIEGSHAFQGEVLMRHLYGIKEKEIDFSKKEKLSNSVAQFNKEKILTTRKIIENDPKYQQQYSLNQYTSILYSMIGQNYNAFSNTMLSQYASVAEKIRAFIAMQELKKNIVTLKTDPDFPVFMVTISHLSWNGMTGHSPALDTKGIGRPLIKRFYRIKASDDQVLLKQWKSLFYSEPINEFGKTLINDLLSVNNGRRVLVDLKHSDYYTRKYFYDSVMCQQQAPPICSHCAVNGLKEIYYSPFVDEYSLINSSADSIFYPFGLNLYDEEITTICKRGGIIGIPLEQRVLGGYFKKERRQLTDFSLRMLTDNVHHRPYFDTIRIHNKVDFDMIRRYNKTVMRIMPKDSAKTCLVRKLNKRSAIITRDDYFSIEPFIQNLFYILDHADTTGRAAWSHVCIGSDLDGIIDPIDICATASQYPHFKQRLLQFIPVFLAIRKIFNKDAHEYTYYFDDTGAKPGSISLHQAVDAVMYNSLKDFVIKYYK